IFVKKRVKKRCIDLVVYEKILTNIIIKEFNTVDTDTSCKQFTRLILMYDSKIFIMIFRKICFFITHPFLVIRFGNIERLLSIAYRINNMTIFVGHTQHVCKSKEIL